MKFTIRSKIRHEIIGIFGAHFGNSCFNTLPDNMEQLNSNGMGDNAIDSIC
jgi:hypothetical protein